MTRTGIVLIGLVYLLQATWILEGGVDLLFPRYQTVSPADDSCCSGACGCSTKEKSDKSCCCFPKKTSSLESPPKQDAPTKVQVSVLEESRCKGTQAAVDALSSQPALPGPMLNPEPPALELRLELTSQSPALPVSATLIDRVPL